MSEIIALANVLRSSSDAFLEQLLANRQISSTSFRDFLDFATALGEPKSLKSAICSLPRSQAQALVALCSGVQPDALDPATLAKLEAQLLVFREPSTADEKTAAAELVVPEAVRATIASFEKVDFSADAGSADGGDRSTAAADRDAGVCAFETMQALTELHFDVDQRYVREVGKRGVGLADLKRLATHLSKTNDFARLIYQLAQQSKLVSASESRWTLGPDADRWLIMTPIERFKFLAAHWLQLLGEDSAAELLAMRLAHPGHSLGALFGHTYPLADSQIHSRIQSLETLANLIGLSAGQSATSWFELVLENKLDLAAAKLAEHLPQTSERLIIQADLSLIAPGPLPTAVEIELRRFAETEQISMASTYRMSALSISHGLETGMTETQIRGLLAKLSDKDLPQPVDYLIRESVARFGRLTVSEGPGDARSLVRSTDPILLTQISNDTQVRAFTLRRTPDGDLFSPREAEVVYFGLRDAGYAAIRVDAAGKVISPRTVAVRTSAISVVRLASNDIARLREHDERIGSDPGGDDLVRQIEFALKNRSKLLISATDRTGATFQFLIEPKNLSNGRLRGIDTKAEIERTIPLERITSAEPVAR